MIRSALAIVCVLAGTAHADQDWKDERAFFEWSTWVRLSYGVASVEQEAPAGVTRVIAPSTRYDQVAAFEAALGADLLFPIPTRHVRLGPWLEVRGIDDVFTGLELHIARSPRDLDMFWYKGEGAWSVRVGASTSAATAAVTWGYRCPWVMFSPAPTTTRYMIGGRIVASVTRGVADAHEWSASLGIEFEPVGAIRYLFGIRSWY